MELSCYLEPNNGKAAAGFSLYSVEPEAEPGGCHSQKETNDTCIRATYLLNVLLPFNIGLQPVSPSHHQPIMLVHTLKRKKLNDVFKKEAVF